MNWKKLNIINDGTMKWWDLFVIFVCAATAGAVTDIIDPNHDMAFYLHLPIYVAIWLVTMFVCCFLKAVIWDKLKNKRQ